MNAIEQLKSVLCNHDGKCCIAGSEEDRAIVDRALHALAQPEQEPVAWQFFQGGKWHNGMEFHDHRKHTIAAGTPVRDLYTAPPPRTGLTDEELSEFDLDPIEAKLMIAKLKDKNT